MNTYKQETLNRQAFQTLTQKTVQHIFMQASYILRAVEANKKFKDKLNNDNAVADIFWFGPDHKKYNFCAEKMPLETIEVYNELLILCKKLETIDTCG